MIRIRGIKIDAHAKSEDNLKKKISKLLNIDINAISNIKILKESIDARNKNNINYVYDVAISIDDEERYIDSINITKYEEELYKFDYPNTINKNDKIVIVGSGPAGLFAAYTLCENGYKPLIIERGEDIDHRVKSVETFWKDNILNEKSNVQFGEGGAGTFSDGKLNTQIKDNIRKGKVLDVFVSSGADGDIKYSNHPHIGTDKLRCVIKNIRKSIIKMGGTILFNSMLTDIVISDGMVSKIVVNNKDEIDASYIILAIGNSARDTFEMLYNKGVKMHSKPFAVGLRVQHKQKDIDLSQYGEKYIDVLSKSSYKLTYTSSHKRGVYSFCMCPGGYVVNASSKNECLAINGMSNHDRESENANSAIIVTVNDKDYGSGALDGMKYQIELEKKAYSLGNGKIPVQLLKDYHDNKESTSFKNVNPIFKGEYNFANLSKLFSDEINNDLKEAFKNFDHKIKGFNNNDVILAGVESRTSSPLVIERDENLESNVKGLFPSGEGAGFAGGIVSSAIDGIKCAEMVAKSICKR